MHLICIAKNITKAGIRAQLSDENNPMIIFVARDHHYISKSFSTVQENQEIRVRIIGKRFELNDPYISIIAELIENKTNGYKPKIKLVTPKGSESSKISISPTVSIISTPSLPSASVAPLPSPISIHPTVSLSSINSGVPISPVVPPSSPVSIPPTSPVTSLPVSIPATSPATDPTTDPATGPLIGPVTSPPVSSVTSSVISQPVANLAASISPIKKDTVES